MFAESRVLAAIGIIVVVLLVPTALVVWAGRRLGKESSGKFLQMFSLAISVLAIAFALVCLGAATIWKGPSGEWAGLALLPPFIINLPAGAIALGIAIAVRHGAPQLRRTCITVAVAALLSPFAAAAIGSWAERYY